MKTIEIDDDVFNYIKNKQQGFELPSVVLRRELRMAPDNSGRGRRRSRQNVFENFQYTEPSNVDECIQHPSFRAQREVVQKFLFTLSWLAKKHKEDFKRVFELRGRKRMYFAESPEAIADSGTKVMPQQIPDTNYWVVTNNDTPKKQRILYDVLHVLGYSVADCNRLSGTLE
jgi:negative modulator of initiation of replication